MREKAIVYCAGNNFVQYYNRITNLYDVYALTDSSSDKWGTQVMGHKVIKLEDIDRSCADLVFIASDRTDIVNAITKKAESLWPNIRIESILSQCKSNITVNLTHEAFSQNDKLGNSIECSGGNLINGIAADFYGNDNRIIIEENVLVKDRISVMMYGDHNTLRIGKGTSILNCVFNLGEGGNITIGSDCMLSSSIEFFQFEFHPIFDTGTGKRINIPEDITIGDHVWIGRNAALMGGFSIGNDSIIGYGTVSSSKFDSGVCIGGSPAKIIRKNVTWGREALGLYDINELSDLRI